TRFSRDWSSDVCSSDLANVTDAARHECTRCKFAGFTRAEHQHLAIGQLPEDSLCEIDSNGPNGYCAARNFCVRAHLFRHPKGPLKQTMQIRTHCSGLSS